MDIKKYFKRIGLSEDTKVSYTYEFLKKLHYAHITNIPYENLDIVDKKPLSLEGEDLYDKIVNQHRGGYCFEVNGFLSYMLSALGFETSDYLGRFLRNESGTPMRRHRVVSVKCEGETYICDVGIGQSSPRYPLKLSEGLVQEQFGEIYKYEKNEYGEWILYDLYKEKWRPFYSFSTEHQHNIDFYQPSYYCETHPSSKFNKTLIISLKTATGRKTIDNRDFKIFEGDEISYIEPDVSDERITQILKKEFGLQRNSV